MLRKKINISDVSLYFIPIKTRVPLKFGSEVVDRVTCARVSITLKDGQGRVSIGWGETPLSVTWVWPGALSYDEREEHLKEFCRKAALSWKELSFGGHPMDTGFRYQEEVLPRILKTYNREARKNGLAQEMPYLAALVCLSPFDIAYHDGYAKMAGAPVYDIYGSSFMRDDLSGYLEPANGAGVSFAGKFPEDFLLPDPPQVLEAWHLVGGTDPVKKSELTGKEPEDGYPVLLKDWILRDGLRCLKIKLRGSDMDWDFQRIVDIGKIGMETGVLWLTADFNCTVNDPEYVNEVLDKLKIDFPRIYGMILYVEQPFPYDLENNQIDVHSVSARKPLFMDESAHDWRLVKLGRTLGWNGVALKTCKTQTGALLALCWAKAHGMTLMVQDLTNPMLAQIPHVQLASRAGTIMGVETNSMQFYPEASKPEESVHPGLYRRREGTVDLSSIRGDGFGYRIDEIRRDLGEPENL